jgi:pimeloyl-ACP methyl ester carboxylesterase
MTTVASIVAIHGIGNEYRGTSVMHAAWFPAMRDGLLLAGGDLRPDELTCAFYGDLFRPSERVLSAESPWYDASDVCAELEWDLLAQWWTAAAAVDPAVVPPDARTLARTPRSVQTALNALSNARFFAGIADRLMILSLKQVRRYLTDDELRAAALARVAKCVGPDTRVLVGHSLGSVVAYEALCAHPEWPVSALVTLGSPLGVRSLIFDRLRPAPGPNGMGAWPGPVSAWTNICDDGDVVASRKDLRPLFGDRVRSVVVYCGSKAHDVGRYLTAEAVGHAIASGIAHA